MENIKINAEKKKVHTLPIPPIQNQQVLTLWYIFFRFFFCVFILYPYIYLCIVGMYVK